MKVSFPDLARKVDVFTGSLKDFFAGKKDKSVDVVLSVEVSMHIHPADNYIFSEMVRVARKYICIIEPESANSNYAFARNYRNVFESRGCSEVRSTFITDDILPGAGYSGCTIRVLKVKDDGAYR
jgi:hypothetical protein